MKEFWICKICQEQEKKKNILLGIEHFWKWDSEKEIIEHIKRKHPTVFKKCREVK